MECQVRSSKYIDYMTPKKKERSPKGEECLIGEIPTRWDVKSEDQSMLII